jgi:hypothetical protein
MHTTHTIVAQPPGIFAESEIQDVLAMVREGGEVGDAVLEENVRKAKCLVVARQDSCLVAVAALKNPKASYRRASTPKAESPSTLTTFLSNSAIFSSFQAHGNEGLEPHSVRLRCLKLLGRECLRPRAQAMPAWSLSSQCSTLLRRGYPTLQPEGAISFSCTCAVPRHNALQPTANPARRLTAAELGC